MACCHGLDPTPTTKITLNERLLCRNISANDEAIHDTDSIEGISAVQCNRLFSRLGDFDQGYGLFRAAKTGSQDDDVIDTVLLVDADKNTLREKLRKWHHWRQSKACSVTRPEMCCVGLFLCFRSSHLPRLAALRWRHEWQAFRTSTSKVITIPTRHDPKSGQRVVRWKDVQQYFENAKGVLSGEGAVLFLTDDGLEE
jgi:hypothetical protein